MSSSNMQAISRQVQSVASAAVAKLGSTRTAVATRAPFIHARKQAFSSVPASWRPSKVTSYTGDRWQVSTSYVQGCRAS
jgi:hypothetical protein